VSKFLIKRSGEVLATVEGDRIVFGSKAVSGGIGLETQLVPDNQLIKQVDGDGNVLWVLGVRRAGNEIVIEEEK
jgi:hypothetical protein